MRFELRSSVSSASANDKKGREMRRLMHMYHTLTVVSVGLLALVIPIGALANDGGPNGS